MSERKIGGCRRGPEDPRDFKVMFSAVPLARKVDLRPLCSAVEQQDQLNSCTANAVVGAMEMLERKQGLPQRDLSRLFVYWNTRVLDGSTGKDAGAYISSAMRAVKASGACLESIWPYNVRAVFSKPSTGAYRDGMLRQAVEYARVAQGSGVLQALNGGLPVVYGTMLYESFEAVTGQTGVVPIPAPGETQVGGHAMLIVGYDLDSKTYLVRNSWGAKWGLAGYCKVPFALVDNPTISWDFWIVRSIEKPPVGFKVVRPGSGIAGWLVGLLSAPVRALSGLLRRRG